MKVDALNVFKEALSLAFRIDGAVVFPEVKITKGKNSEDDKIELSEMNPDYTYALIQKDSKFLFASKDGQDFVVAVEVKLPTGEIFNCMELYALLFE